MTTMQTPDPVAKSLLRSAIVVFGGAALLAGGVALWRSSRSDASAAAAVASSAPTMVTLQSLSDFVYDPAPLEYDAQGAPIPPKSDPLPPKIRALSGKRVVMDGYMAPIDVDPSDGTCTHFMLMISLPSCCFGCQLKANNYVDVRMTSGKRATSAPPYAVRVEGVITMHRPEEELSALYTMTADSATAVDVSR